MAFATGDVVFAYLNVAYPRWPAIIRCRSPGGVYQLEYIRLPARLSPTSSRFEEENMLPYSQKILAQVRMEAIGRQDEDLKNAVTEAVRMRIMPQHVPPVLPA